MHNFLIVKTGSTFSSLSERRGDFEDWFLKHLGFASSIVRIVKPHEGDDLPDPHQLSGVLVTGSHAMVTDRDDWSERTAAWLPSVVQAEIPMLAVCYGHQLLAQAMGGVVENNPAGSVFGTIEVKLTESAAHDPLFRGLGPILHLHATHTQSVIKLPPGAVLLAVSESDPHHTFSLGSSAWSLQFHPEFDAEVVRAYIERCSKSLRAEGLDPQSLKRAVKDTPYGEQIMLRFREIVLAKGR
jgi:GMP synthase (glutamine-hydrolysing)